MTQTKSLQDLDVLIQQISDATGLKQKQISAQLEQASIPSFQFSDAILVAPEDLDPIIDNWAASIKQQISGKSTPAKANEPIEIAEAIEETQTQTPAVETGDLSWPDGYESLVSHLYTPTLKKILPQDANQRQAFIDAINQKTPEGDRLVTELAQTIVKRSKRNLAFEKVLAGLQAKIAQM